MKRILLALSIMSFMTIVIYALLMAFDVLNPIIHVKYFVICFSLCFTLLTLYLFVSSQEVNNLLSILMVLLLFIPVLVTLLGLFSAEVYLEFWKLILGGTVFQIGTGIFAILDGFKQKQIKAATKYMPLMNYILFLFLAFILIFDISTFTEGPAFIVIGSVASLLSLFLIFQKKSDKRHIA